jgi:hypothetical protein
MSKLAKRALIAGAMIELSFCCLIVLGFLAGANPVCASGSSPFGNGLLIVGVIGHWPMGFLLKDLVFTSSTRLFGVCFTAIWQALIWSALYWVMAAFRNSAQELKEKERIERTKQWTDLLEAEREKF